MVSRRFHEFSKAAYVRAHYFLVHYGPAEAMFYALGRGKVLTEQVIDVSGRPTGITSQQSSKHLLTTRPSRLCLDFALQRCPFVPLSCANSDAPLFPHPSPFHPNVLGP
jgi:hypothetical protein